jgi:hypothetical protein
MDNNHMHDDDDANRRDHRGISPLEMEILAPSAAVHTHRPQPSFWQQCFQLTSLYVELYPRVTAAVAAFACVLVVYAFVSQFSHPLSRNTMHHHYSDIDLQYNFKASQLDHWCLFVSSSSAECPFQSAYSTEILKGMTHMNSLLYNRSMNLGCELIRFVFVLQPS